MSCDGLEEALRRSLDAERAWITGPQRVIARVLELARQTGTLPVLYCRTADEILGCDESGISQAAW